MEARGHRDYESWGQKAWFDRKGGARRFGKTRGKDREGPYSGIQYSGWLMKRRVWPNGRVGVTLRPHKA